MSWRRQRAGVVGALAALLAWGGAARGAEPSSVALDALAYTVVRTPPSERVAVGPLERGRNVLVDRVRVFPGREVPPVLWYDAAGMSYGLAYRETRAPLVFLIAGTGGSFNTDTNRLLARVLHDAGFHVLGLPSPTPPSPTPPSPAKWGRNRR